MSDNEACVLLRGIALAKFFGRGASRHQVLFDVDVELHSGECLAIIGGSGSGKSTLTRILLGLQSPDAGAVLYKGRPLFATAPSAFSRENAAQAPTTMRKTAFSRENAVDDPQTGPVATFSRENAASVRSSQRQGWGVFRRRRRPRLPAYLALRRESGLVFQNPFASLDPGWDVSRSIAEPLRIQRRDLGRQSLEDRVRRALATVGLDPREFASRYPMDLSGGQAQRVAIARAIVNEPRVIVADEPMSAIDVTARIQILDAFATIRQERPQTGLILVSHDLGVVQHIADRILVLHKGRVEEYGAANRVLDHPKAAYTRSLIEAATL